MRGEASGEGAGGRVAAPSKPPVQAAPRENGPEHDDRGACGPEPGDGLQPRGRRSARPGARGQPGQRGNEAAEAGEAGEGAGGEHGRPGDARAVVVVPKLVEQHGAEEHGGRARQQEQPQGRRRARPEGPGLGERIHGRGSRRARAARIIASSSSSSASDSSCPRSPRRPATAAGTESSKKVRSRRRTAPSRAVARGTAGR